MRDVVFSCDDNGVKFLRVVLWSLLDHYRGANPLRINILTGFGGHSAANRQLVEGLVSSFNRCRASKSSSSELFSLRYIDVEPILGPLKDKLLRPGSRWNIFTWSSIIGPDAVPDATGNLLYLDIDQLVNADVSELFELDLGDHLLAAVYENHRGNPFGSQREWEVGILPPEAERYLNVGTMVFNAEAFRRERVMQQLVDWYVAHADIATRIDQDAFNAVCWRHVLPLPVAWGFHDRTMKQFLRGEVTDKYWLGNPPRECLEAALAPKIFHFMGRKKPWRPSHRPYRGVYHEAMRAVGVPVPKEEWLAVFHDWANARLRARLQLRLEYIENWQSRIPTEALFLKGVRRFRRRAVVKRVKHVLIWPFEWMGILLGLTLFAVLPHRAMLAFCDFVSAVYYRFDRRGRAFARENLGYLLEKSGGSANDVNGREVHERRMEKIIRRSYRNMCRTVGHAFWTCFRARQRVRSAGELSAMCQAFLAANKPAVTVSGHLGCWEILSQLALLAGHKMMSVAKNIGTKGMTRLLMHSRRSIGQRIVSADGAFKPLLKGVKDGCSLGLLVDQRVDPDEGGVWVRFLGKPMPVSAAPAFFALKAKVPIAIAWSRPLKNGRYRCELVKTYLTAADKAKQGSPDIWSLTQAIATDLERVIRRHPSCWLCNYNFFSNIPTSKDLDTLAARERATKADVAQT